MSGLLTLLVALCTVEAVMFVAVYAWRSPWRSSPMGRHLMAFGTTVTILLGMRLWSRLMGSLPDGVWVAGFGLLAVVLAWRIRLVLRAQRRP